MNNAGAGAKAAWHAHSRAVLAEIGDLFSPEAVERLAFEEGERRREAVLAAYDRCNASGSISSVRFESLDRLRLAASQEILGRMTGAVDIFLQNSEVKGVYRAQAVAVSNRIIELLLYDGSSIFVCDNEGACVLLDFESEITGKRYELQVWNILRGSH